MGERKREEGEVRGCGRLNEGIKMRNGLILFDDEFWKHQTPCLLEHTTESARALGCCVQLV